MSGTGPLFPHPLQQTIDDIREQAMLLPPGTKRNRVFARADALEVTMKTFPSVTSPALRTRRDY